MKIKQLKLTGFKSFVEPVSLGIEDGLTGVVGPNGCGKSNLLEALRWVMGESSPKSMRGGGMDDVIFAGTASRPARDFAEVSLLVERSADDIPDEAGGASSARGLAGEAEISRRIEREAGSAYRINGRDVRQRDVALLFADAATGAHSPALVSQGRISAVIAAKPVDRRLMLEEAAGIAGLHVRRKDAEQKLRATEANLERLGEMLVDMEQRSLSLRRQAKAAERYRKLSDRIREAEARLTFARWRDAARDAEAARTEAAAADADVGAAGEAQARAAVDRTAALEALTGLRAAAQEARERMAELGHRLATLRAEHDGIAARITELESRETALLADRGREGALAQDAAAAIARLDEEVARIARSLASAETVEAEAALVRADLARHAGAADGELAQALARQASELAEARIVEERLAAARERSERASGQGRQVEADKAALATSDSLAAALEAARTARSSASARFEGAASAIASAEEDRTNAAAARDRAEHGLASARAALAALVAERDALAAEPSPSGAGARAIDCVKAAPGYERALGAALGEDLDAAIGGAGPRRWAGAERDASDPALPAGLASLADHVDAPPELARRLAQVAVAAEDRGERLAIGQRLVTLDGRLRRWDGFVGSGLGSAAAQSLIRANRMAEIQAALPAAESRAEAASEAITEALRNLEAASRAAGEARRGESEFGQQLRESSRAEDQATVAIERLELQHAMLAERAERAAADARAASEAMREAERDAAGLPDGEATASRVASLRAAADTAQAALADARAEAAARGRALEADKTRAVEAASEAKDWRARATTAAARSADLDLRIASAAEERGRLADAPERLAGSLAAAQAERDAAEASAHEAVEAEQKGEALRVGCEARQAEAGEALSTARERRAGAAARLENHLARQTEMERIASERFACAPDALGARHGFDPDKISPASEESAAHERMIADRERLGAVNLVAEQELGEIDAQRAESEAERAELAQAINRLRGSIGTLNREGRVRLLESFERVDRHFRSLFTTLFEGGQAHLALVEADDPLEAGLEIMAQPPGKKLAALTLLSGGEQALTAIALIFALFLTNPAPICVLDEVDAPLDDANIERFCGLLDRMTQETDTRYLIVTHNAVTMSRMHRLFGVTMVEQGVSRLVSVDLGGAERLLAAE